MNIISKITNFLSEPPSITYNQGKISFNEVPDDIRTYLRFFNTRIERFIFDSFGSEPDLDNVLFIGESPKGYWSKNQWLPLYSFYLDQSLGINHFLRKRDGSHVYLPIQQIYEEFILAVSSGKLDQFTNLKRYQYSHLGQLILECLNDNDLPKIEKLLFGKLLGSAFLSEEIQTADSYSYFKIEKLDRALLYRKNSTIVFFGNGNHLSIDDLETYTVQSLLDIIYMNISNEVAINSYGKDWLLFNVESNELILESEITRCEFLSKSKFSNGVFVVLIKKSWFLPNKLRVI
jgi:hypothetical protein